MNKKIGLIVGVVIALVALFAGGAYFYKQEQKLKQSLVIESQSDAFIRPHSPRIGGQHPKVFLVEFLDPECEACRHFAPLVKSILNEFGEDVQLIVRFMPYHQNSRFAIRVLEASRRQGKFWEALDVLFQHQPEWGSHHDPQPNLIWNYLPEAGVNVEEARADFNDPKIEELINQDEADGKALRIQGTPSFFVNGKPLQDFGYEQLRQMVAEEIKRK